MAQLVNMLVCAVSLDRFCTIVGMLAAESREKYVVVALTVLDISLGVTQPLDKWMMVNAP